MAPGRRSNAASTAAMMSASGTAFVPNVSIITLTGFAMPMA